MTTSPEFIRGLQQLKERTDNEVQQNIEHWNKIALLQPVIALQNLQVSQLFQHYIDVLAPWYDLNDLDSNFGTVVPFHALTNPVLFKALIAFSGSHRCRVYKELREIAHSFHAACVQELLLSINSIELEEHDTYLAATCLLRNYEVLNGKELSIRIVGYIFINR